MIRPDFIAVGLLSVALWCFVRSQRSDHANSLWMYASVLFCIAAVFTKITLWATPICLALLSLRRGLRTFLPWVFAVVVLAVALAGWNAWSGGGFLAHVVTSQSGLIAFKIFEHELSETIVVVGGFGSPPHLVIAGGWSFVLFQSRMSHSRVERPLRYLDLHVLLFLLTSVLPVPLMTKWGSNNYYIEFAVAGALAVSYFLSPAIRRGLGDHSGRVLAVSAAATVLALTTSAHGPPLEHQIVNFDAFGGVAAALDAPSQTLELEPQVEELVRDKVVLADTESMPAVMLAGGNIALNDPAFWNVQFAAGKSQLDMEALGRPLRDGEVDLLVLSVPLRQWIQGPPSFGFRGQVRNPTSVFVYEQSLLRDYQLIGEFPGSPPSRPMPMFVYGYRGAFE